jgi:large subunit ribosomal protein L7/L12
MADETKPEAEVTETPAAEEPKAEAKEEAKAEPKAEKKADVKLGKKQQEVLDAVKAMTVLEVADLVKAMEEEFGVSAAAPMAMGMMPAAGAAAAGEPVEEKSAFDVVLVSAGEQKIQAIKVVREFTELGLKEAKDLVDAGGTIKEGVKKEEAEDMKKKLEEVGATVELK